MTTLQLKKVGPIVDAEIEFGDLTVFVGPQASGKSIALQWLKLIADTGAVQEQLHNYGLDWSTEPGEFLDLYFGEGMRSQWRHDSEILWNGRPVNMQSKVGRIARSKTESVFLIPAQRVLALRNGWPRPFGDYDSGDPFTVRAYSERLRILMEKELGRGNYVFPQANRLKGDYRKLLQSNVFGDFNLEIDKLRSQKRLVLRAGGESDAPLPYMVWSAGQREFVPLLLGLYWLMPPAKVARRNEIKWVVIEELEMGLHPRAITTILLLILELLSRDYKVCLSTHSPQVLDLVWALRALQTHRASADDLLAVFEAPKTAPLRQVATEVLKKSAKVYYFQRSHGTVKDITNLDPSSQVLEEATWGGLMEFSGRANEAVAKAVANGLDRD